MVAPTVSTVLLDVVVPVLGALVALGMFSSPMNAVLRMRRTRILGELNSLVFPVIVANCGGWVGYSMVELDPFVFVPNALGLLLGLFYTLSATRFADTQAQDRIIQISTFFAALLLTVGAVTTFAHLPHATNIFVWGVASNLILFSYYASPLSTIAKVFRTRSAASIHAPICATNVLNGVLWTAYGLATAQPFLFVPNAIGAALALSQVALCCIFRGKGTGAAGDAEAPAAAGAGPPAALRAAAGAAFESKTSTSSVDGLLPAMDELSAAVDFAGPARPLAAGPAPAKRWRKPLRQGTHVTATADRPAAAPL